MNDINVVVVDDDPRITEAFAKIIDSFPQMRCVATFASAEMALASDLWSKVDVLLMDVQLPNMDGITAAKEIQRSHPHLEIVFITAYDNGRMLDLAAGMRAGFVLKGVSAQRLEVVIQAAHAGLSVITKASLPKLSQSRVDPACFNISPREAEVLAALVAGWSNRQICLTFHLSPGTVKTHVSALIKKLEVRSRLELAAMARQLGLTLPPLPPP